MVTGHRLWWHRGRRDVGAAAGAATPRGRGHGKQHVGTSRGPRGVTLAPRRAGGEDLVPTPQGQRGKHNCGPAGGAHTPPCPALVPGVQSTVPTGSLPRHCASAPAHLVAFPLSLCHQCVAAGATWTSDPGAGGTLVPRPAPAASHTAWWHAGTCASFGAFLFTSSSHHQPACTTPPPQEAQDRYLDNSLLRTRNNHPLKPIINL